MTRPALETMRSRTQPRRVLTISIAAGVLTTLLVVLAGVLYLGGRETRYQATSSVVVLPESTLTPADTVSALDALSRGQVVATFARVLGGQGLTTTALDTLNINQSERAAVKSDIHPVVNTSIITITVSGPTRRIVEDVAGAIARTTATTRESLQPLFAASVVDTGAGSATLVGTNSSTILLAFLAIAIVGGIVTQQILFQGAMLVMSGRDRSWVNGQTRMATRTNVETNPEAALANGEGRREPSRASARDTDRGSPAGARTGSEPVSKKKAASASRTPSKRSQVANQSDVTDAAPVDSGAGAPLETGDRSSVSWWKKDT